ncbi:hypothetical protein ACS8Y6_00730 [Salinisphaera sp. RV14]|uniref:hypothetical protein n=1 Tax=unclassified Salinisphaera TaxID=2649847 RepID=UPI003F8783F5
MWRAIKHRAARLGGLATADRSGAREASLRLTLPNPYGGPAWVTATLALSARQRGMGETVRVRGHIDSCFRMPAHGADRVALAHETTADAHPLTRYARRAAASLTRRAVARLPRGAGLQLAEQRRRRWIDMQISTAPLAAGAAALMPEALRAVYGDRLPQAMPGGPRVGVWSGPAGGPRGGLARLAMVQFDQRDRDGHYGSDADERFSLNLSLAEVVEPAGDSDHPE